jgi:hypothetical protein
MIFWHTFCYTVHIQERETKEKEKDEEVNITKLPLCISFLALKLCSSITTSNFIGVDNKPFYIKIIGLLQNKQQE